METEMSEPEQKVRAMQTAKYWTEKARRVESLHAQKEKPLDPISRLLSDAEPELLSTNLMWR
jgi:hypothetical protein